MYVFNLKKSLHLSVNEIGNKGLNETKLFFYGFNVPDAYILSTEAFRDVLNANNFFEFLKKLFLSIDLSNTDQLRKASTEAQNFIINLDFNENIKSEIIQAYKSLSPLRDSFVAVRSSNNLSIEKSRYFFEEKSTFLNVIGIEDLLKKIKLVWANPFSFENIKSSIQQKFNLFNIKIAVLIQKMVQAEASGEVFSVNPIDNDASIVSIDAKLGLNSNLLFDEQICDNYIIEKKTGKILKKFIAPQDKMIVRKGRVKFGEETNVIIKISEIWKKRQKIDDKYIFALFDAVKKLESIYNYALSFEFVIEGSKIFIMNLKPIDFLFSKKLIKELPVSKNDFSVQIQNRSSKIQFAYKGIPVNGGIVSAKIFFNSGKHDIPQILVVKKLESKTQIAKNIVGIISESDDDERIHVIASSLNVPAVKGLTGILNQLKNDDIVTVNGDLGIVDFKTDLQGTINANKIFSKRNKNVFIDEELKIKNEKSTATKVFVNVGLEKIKAFSRVADGFAFFDIDDEFSRFGFHPKELVQNSQKMNDFINQITTRLFKIANDFFHKEVIVKLSENDSSYYQKLIGGRKFEQIDNNPKLSIRGASRLINSFDETREILSVIKSLRNKENFRNISIAIPFVREINELLEAKKLLAGEKLKRTASFKLYFFIQNMFNVLAINDFIDVGIDGVIIDPVKILESLFFANISESFFTENKDDFLNAISMVLKKVVSVTNKKFVKSIFLLSKSFLSEELVKMIVKYGVNAVIIDGNQFEKVKDLLYRVELSSLLFKKK